MSKLTTVHCDRCRDQVMPGVSYMRLTTALQRPAQEGVDVGTLKGFDLCDRCEDLLREWLRAIAKRQESTSG